jgi:hypothetical protein
MDPSLRREILKNRVRMNQFDHAFKLSPRCAVCVPVGAVSKRSSVTTSFTTFDRYAATLLGWSVLAELELARWCTPPIDSYIRGAEPVLPVTLGTSAA